MTIDLRKLGETLSSRAMLTTSRQGRLSESEANMFADMVESHLKPEKGEKADTLPIPLTIETLVRDLKANRKLAKALKRVLRFYGVGDV